MIRIMNYLQESIMNIYYNRFKNLICISICNDIHFYRYYIYFKYQNCIKRHKIGFFPCIICNKYAAISGCPSYN